MIKIKMECWWTNPGSLIDRFKKQFVPDEDLSLYEFTTDNDYDFLVILGRTDFESISFNKDRIFLFSQEPIWSPNEQKDTWHKYTNNAFVSDKRKYPPSDSYKEGLLPMLYGGHGQLDPDENWSWDKRMFDKDYTSEKTKNISAVVTNNWNSTYDGLSDPNSSELIYKWRTELINYVAQKAPFVDIWGIHQPNNGVNVHGEAWNKLLPLRGYKFSICMENSIQKNYISEKFWDVILADTVPIYLGCNNIDEYIPKDYYINIRGFKNMPEAEGYAGVVEALNQINANADAIYASYLPKIKELKKLYKTDPRFNIWEKIKSEIKSKL